MKKSLMMLAGILFLSTCGYAVDKKEIETHLRKALNLDPRQLVEVGDPIKTKFKGVTQVPIGSGRSKQNIWIMDDGKSYIFGHIFDLSVDPDKERVKKMDLSDHFMKGSKNAKVTIVEYSDLQCPFCRKSHKIVQDNLFATYSEDEVRLVFKHFPLRNHKWAEPGAVAVECAGEQSEVAYWEMLDLLFDHAPSITEGNINEKKFEFAKKLGLRKSKFKSCIEQGDALKRVQADKNEGIKVGVTSTPTFFVNGSMKRGIRSFQDLKATIDQKLGKN